MAVLFCFQTIADGCQFFLGTVYVKIFQVLHEGRYLGFFRKAVKLGTYRFKQGDCSAQVIVQ